MKTKFSLVKQSILSISLIIFVALISHFISGLLGYKVVAFLLLLTVSFLAMIFEIIPVMLSAILSAFIWNFFFIPPVYTFHIGSADDLLMFLMYFIVATINAVLSIKIREQEKKTRLKEEQENSIKLYNTLLNSLSHELKTPIATIIAGVDTLKENNDKLSTNNKNDILNEIEISSIRLNRNVENLLNMSRLENGMLRAKKDWVDINELVFKSIEHINEKYSQQIIYIQREEFPLVKIDSGLMEQVLKNLLLNSILYCPEDTKIFINITIDDYILKINISDEGPGINLEFIDFLFDKFYRIPNSKTGGTGLGLYIVKGFVDAHGGTISVKNREAKGVEFQIEIPTECSYVKNLKNE